VDNSENILWSVAAVCTVIWLVGWVGLNAGIWVHTFIAAAMAIAIMIFAAGLKEHREAR